MLLATPSEIEPTMNATRKPTKSSAPLRGAAVVPPDRDQLRGNPGGNETDVIAIKNLRIEYRSRELGNQTKLAVRDLTLSIHAGEVFGFLGPNGAGKTSTMNVLLGFVPPTRGTANIFGVNVQQTIARQRLGYLPELTYYYKFLTAEELLRFYSRIFGIEKVERERCIDALLKLVELEHARKQLIKNYSKGMQQRVGLAQRQRCNLVDRQPGLAEERQLLGRRALAVVRPWPILREVDADRGERVAPPQLVDHRRLLRFLFLLRQLQRQLERHRLAARTRGSGEALGDRRQLLVAAGEDVAHLRQPLAAVASHAV